MLDTGKNDRLDPETDRTEPLVALPVIGIAVPATVNIDAETVLDGSIIFLLISSVFVVGPIS
jgi:hypothetical protein